MNEQQCTSLVYARAGGRCERCGGIVGLSRHHRKKRGQGGEWDPTNIVVVCGDGVTRCHGWIEANPAAAEVDGYHVRPWDDPAERPVKLADGEWYLLRPDGEVKESDPYEPDPGE